MKRDRRSQTNRDAGTEKVRVECVRNAQLGYRYCIVHAGPLHSYSVHRLNISHKSGSRNPQPRGNTAEAGISDQLSLYGTSGSRAPPPKPPAWFSARQASSARSCATSVARREIVRSVRASSGDRGCGGCSGGAGGGGGGGGGGSGGGGGCSANDAVHAPITASGDAPVPR